MKIQFRKTSSKSTRKNRATGSRSVLATSIATLAASLLLATSDRGLAVNGTWLGAPTNGNWVAGAAETNWSSGINTFPGATAGTANADTAFFGIPTATTAVTINSATLNIGSITFNAAAPAMTIGTLGGNSLLLSSGGAINHSAGAVETINAGLSLQGAAGNYAINADGVAAGNTLVIAGPVSAAAAGAYALNIGGANTGANAFTGVISNGAGTLNLVKTGAGNWILGNTNTYTGTTTINGGTLTVNGSIAAGSTVAVNSGATLAGTGTINGLVNVTSGGVGGTINLGAGGNIVGLLSIGLGNWNGQGTASAGVNVGGTGVTIGAGANMTVAPGFALNVFNNATLTGAAANSTLTGSLNYTSTAASNFGGIIAGAGSSVTLNNAAAVLTLSGANTYGGATNVQSGTLLIGATNTLPTATVVNLNNAAGNGTANLTLTGFNQTVGSLNIVAPAAGGASAVNIGAGRALTVNGNIGVVNNTTAAGNGLASSINGPGALDLGGATRTFSVAGQNIGVGGVVNIGGLVVSAVVQNGGVNINATNSTFNPNAEGRVVFSGNNTYTGVTTVQAGVLQITNNNALGSTLAANNTVVNSGGTLELTGGVTGLNEALVLNGTGATSAGATKLGALHLIAGGVTATVNGAITINTGAVINANGGTLNMGGLITLTADGTISAFGGTVNITGGVSKVGVNLTLGGTTPEQAGGTINISGPGAGGFGITGNNVGFYNSDLIVNNATVNEDIANNYVGRTFIRSTLAAGTGILNTGVANALPTALGRTAVTMDDGGSLGSSVLNIGGTPVNPAGANQAIASLIGAASSRVTLGNNTLTIGFGTGINVNGDAAAIFRGVISGNGGVFAIVKDDTSRQIFTGTNTYVGFTSINNGTLQVGDGATANSALGPNLVFVNAGGTLDIKIGQNGTFVNTVNTVAGGNVVTTNTAAQGIQTISGAINGGGSLTQNQNGTTILANVNTYQGGTRITNGGTIQIGTPAAGATAGQNIAANTVQVDSGGTLTLVNVSGGVLNNDINNATAATTGNVVANSTFTTKLTGALTNSGAGATLTLTQSGSGTTILTNIGNTYTGANTITGGTLQVGEVGTAGSLGGANVTVGTGGTLSLVNIGGPGINVFANNVTGSAAAGVGTLNVNSANNNQITGTLSDGAPGTLALTQTGLGTTIIANTNAYTGGTTISAGILQVGNGAANGSLGTGAVLNNATLNFNRSDTNTFANIINGSGVVNKNLANSLTLMGVNTYAGATNVNAGTLVVGNAAALGNAVGGTVVAAGATLDLNSFNVGAEPLNIQGAGVAGFALTNGVGGAAVLNGPVTLAGVVPTIIGGNLGSITLGGSISGPGAVALIKAGTNTVALTGSNNYGGVTNVTQGILQVGDPSALGSTGANTFVTAGAALQILNGTNVGAEPLTINGVGTGAAAPGALTQVAGATSSFAGPITVATNSTINANGGALTLSGPINKAGVNLTLAGVGGAGSSITVNGVISGGALGTFNSDLNVNGTTVNVNAANTYLGPTTIDSIVAGDGILNANVLNALPTANGRTTIAMDTVSGPGSSVLNLAANQSIASLNNTTGIAVGGSIVNLGGNTLTIGNGTGLNINGLANANFAGAINGAGGITKDDTSRQIFSGANGYTGTTNVNSGILSIQNGAGLGQANGTAGAGTVVATGAVLQLQGGINVGNEALTLNGTGAAAGQNGALINTAGGNTFGGLITLGSNSTISSDVGTLALTNLGTIVGGGNALTLTGAGNGSVTSVISATVSSLTKNGGGQWTLNGVNTFTGTTAVNNGVLQAGAANSAFGIGSAVSLTNVGGVSTLDLNGNSNAVGSLNGVAGSFVDNTSATAATLTTGSLGTNATFTGTIQNTGGPASLALTKVGVGSLTLNGATANTFGGGTTLNDGTLNADKNTALGTGTFTINAAQTPVTFPTGVVFGSTVNGTTLANPVAVNANFTITTAGNLIFTGPVSLQNGTRIITGTTNQSQPTFSGVISNGPGVGAGGITFTTPTPGTAGFPLPVGVINPYVAFIMNNNAAPNTYTGLTTVSNNAVLVFNGNVANVNKVAGNIQIDGNAIVEHLAASHQIADTATVTVNSPGSQIINALPGARFQGFDLNNFSETIATLNSGFNPITGAPITTGTVGLGAGTLIVSSGNYAGAIVPSTANGSTGTGVFQKNGAGTLTLTGNSTYTGTTRITAGTVAVGSTKALGNAGLVITGGTLRNSTLGTTNVAQNLNIGAGNISITGGTVAAIIGGADVAAGHPFLHDQITTTGGVIVPIAGVLALTRTNGYLLKSGDKATLVKTGAAGVSGGSPSGTILAANNTTVNGVDTKKQFSNTPLLIPTVYLYSDARGVVLEAMQGSFSGLNGFVQPDGSVFTLTPNQQAVAATLDGIAAGHNNNTGVNSAAGRALDFINNEASRFGLASAAQNLDLLAPEELTAVFTIGNALSNLQHTNLQRHFEELRAEAGSAARGGFPGINSESAFGMNGPTGKGGKEIRPPRQMSGNERWGTFLMGSGNFTSVGSTSNAGGYNLDTGGVTVGLEYKIAENFVVGIDAGYASTTARLVNGGKVDVDGGQFGIFASYFDMGYYVDAAVHGGVASYKTRRTALGGVETASPEGTSFSALLAAGYDWKFGGLTVGPVATFQYTNTRLNGFTENGGSLAPLAVNGHNAESTRTTFGVRAFYDANVSGIVVRPELRLAWQHEYSDTTHVLTSNFSTLGGTPFNVSGPRIGRDSMLVGAGVTVVWNSLLSTFLAYDGELARTNYESHSVSGGVRVKF